VSAVQSRRPIKMWVSKKSEAPIPIGSTVTLYKLNMGDKPVLTYDETAAHYANKASAAPIFLSVFTVLGACGCLGCFFAHRRFVTHRPVQQPASPGLT
jgi:hypothetical protein